MENNKMDNGKRHSGNVSQKYSKKNQLPNEYTPVMGKRAGEEVIKEFLKQKNVAPWFRGTSHNHIQGADMLFNALRDDREQKTTHRVRTCLNLIGLKPIITSKQIQFLTHLSRGNDLVFLWFLMEMHYKTPKTDPNSYSINEQLICSAICHLDMAATLQELDRILPGGHTSKVDTKTAAKARQRTKKESFTEQRNKTISHKFVLPYFKKYRRPEPYGKSLFLKEPNFKTDFNLYDRFKNPNRVIQNESNCWYADYRFNAGKRIVYFIIRETIKNMFNNLSTVSIKLRSTQILCEHHRTLKRMAIEEQHELNVKARNKCFKPRKNHEDNAKKICGLLDEAVQRELSRFNEQNKKQRMNSPSLKVICSDCETYPVILGANEFGNNDGNVINDKTTAQPGSSTKHEICIFNGKEPDLKLENSNHASHIDSNNTYCSISDKVFHCSLQHRPFEFDYEKIFASKFQDDKRRIQNMFLTALGENISNLPADMYQSGQIYDECIKKCTEEIFKNEVKNYEAENMNEIEYQKANKDFVSIGKYPLSANYSAENYYMLEEMLFEAFQYLRKNPKFVWAQLPDAHKVPSLREWIGLRFGKEYTPAERVKSYRRSCIIFRSLDKSNVKFSVPNANKTGRNCIVNYSCRKYVDRKAGIYLPLLFSIRPIIVCNIDSFYSVEQHGDT